MVDSEYILKRVRKIDMLPTFPEIVGGIISVIEDPMSSASDLAKKFDPSMVGEVLRIANTAYFGTRNFRRISKIEHAIAIIGFEHLSYIVLQMPFLSMVYEGDTVFDKKAFIRHSIACAIISRTISSATGLANPNEVYMSGMMHDIGAIIIFRYFRREWNEINRLIRYEGIPRTEAETKVLSVDHGYIGALLLENWNIPKTITDTVMFHHNPDKSSDNRNGATVTCLGNELAKGIDFEEDLAGFDGFLNKQRDFMAAIAVSGRHFALSDEKGFIEKIYVLIKAIKNYIEGTAEREEDDKSSCC